MSSPLPLKPATLPSVADAQHDFRLKKVRLCGLQSKPELNGRPGQVLEYDATTQRWEVMLKGGAKTYWLKPSNLVLDSETPPPPAVARPPSDPSDSDVAQFLRGLPSALAFVRTCAAARDLVIEALGGQRTRAIRFFFEAADDALAMVAEEVRAARPQKLWHATPFPVSHLPDETCDFHQQLEQQCMALRQLRGFRRIRLVPVDNGFFAAFLAVLDGLLMAPEGAEVAVEWKVPPTFQHFTYAPTQPSGCVWREWTDD